MALRSITSEGAEPDRTTHYIIAGAAGGALLLSVAIGTFCRRKSRTTPPPGSFPRIPSTNAVAPTATAATRAPERENIVAIPQREGDDVSALQGPGGAMITADALRADSTVGGSAMSSAHRGYVWEVGRERLDTGGSTTVTGGGADARFVEDRSLEGIYQIPHGACERSPGSGDTLTAVAPPGKLGIIVDNPRGDVPIVHAVKDTSVLKGRVRAGDLLISVDAIDCWGMSAARVSALISSRSDNPARTLVLRRGTVSC